MKFLWFIRDVLKKNKVLIYAVFPLIIYCACLLIKEKQQTESVWAEYLLDHSVFESVYFSTTGDFRQSVKVIKKGDEYHAYLPFSENDELKVYYDYCDYIIIDGEKFSNGERLNGIKKHTRYEIAAVDSEDNIVEHSLICFYFQDTLPTLYVKTESGSMEKVHEDKNFSEAATYAVYTAEGELNSTGYCDIKGRGNTSWNKEQKPYNLDLGREASILGMTSSEEWALLANYGEMLPQLKNKTAYELAESLGMPYTSQCEFVNLYLNGEYRGLYLLVRRINMDPEMYLLEFDTRYKDEEVYFKTKHQKVAVKSPAEISDEQKLYIEDVMKNAELAIYSDNGMHPSTGKAYQEYIDVDSWSKMYMLQDYLVQYDVEFSSFFIYKKNEEDILYAGPVWDFDLSCGKFYMGNYPELAQNLMWLKDIRGEWLTELQEHDGFAAYTKERWINEFSPLINSFLEEEYFDIVEPLESAIEMEAVRFDKAGIDAEEQIDGLYDWLDARREFLDNYYRNPDEYCKINFEFSWATVPYYIEKNTALEFLPCDRDDRKTITGWVNENGEALTEETVIYNDVIYYPVYEENP